MSKKKKIGLWVLGAFVVLGVLGAVFGEDEESEPESTAPTTTTEPDREPELTATTAPTVTTEPEREPEPTATTAPTTTTVAESVGERNARESAADYLEYSSFSRSGLIGQLEFEGFTPAQAEYGVDAVDADWNEQAALSAADYLEYSSFSRSGLIGQLEFEGFTPAQAEYGVDAVGY